MKINNKLGAFAMTMFMVGAAFAGDAAADKAQAKKDREKANQLWTDSNKNHDQSIKDFDAAFALEEKSRGQKAEARKLDYEAFLLDRDAAKDSRIGALKFYIAREESIVRQYESGLKAQQARDAHYTATVKDEEKALADMKGAEANEKNAGTKDIMAGTIAAIEGEIKNDKADLEGAKAAEKRDSDAIAAHRAQADVLKAELKKLGG